MISKTSVKNLKKHYLHENIIIYLKDTNVPVPDSEGNIMEVSGVIMGCVLDVDQDFIHLGDNGYIEKVYHMEVMVQLKL